MNDDFRQRVFLPVVLPLGVMLAIFAVAFSMSRVMLAVPKTVATLLALFAAGYVLIVAVLVAARPRISGRALGIGLVVGVAAILTAGLVGANAGMRELHHEDDHAAEETDGEAVEDGEAAVEADGTWVAVDIDYSESPDALDAGASIALVNEGGIFHDVVIEETGDVLLEAEGGQTDEGTLELDSGEYTYYCSVPGHREAGMEGTITVN